MPVVTWWGHATATVEDSGTRILTDPLFGAWLGHLRRRRGPVPGPTARDADLVVVSHAHHDHLDVASLAAIPAHVPIVLPRGAVALVGAARRLRGRELVEVAPGDEIKVGPVTVTAVPARHDGRRRRGTRLAALTLGYVISGAARTYYAGDTGLFCDLADAVGGCDVALLPVGGWGPQLGPGHLDPIMAAGLLPLLGAREAVPVHFGTFWPVGMERVRPYEFIGPGRRFRQHSAVLAPRVAVHELAPGESVHLRDPVRP